MKTKMTQPELGDLEQLKGQWVALDNCRYDRSTRQPVEGDVVDADQDLAELCGRIRETGRSSCTILFCDEDLVVETQRSAQAALPERHNLTR